MKNKRLALGSYTFTMALIALAAVILVNVLIGSLPSSLKQWDLTDQGLFTIDEQTQKIVGALQEDITVYLIAEHGQEDSTITQLLTRYQDLNGHIRVKQVDPVENPKFVSRYTDLALNQNSLIVDGVKRDKVIDYTEIYTITSEEYLEYYYTYGQYIPDTFAGENALTGGINYVVTDVLPTVGVLKGHGELSLSDSMIQMMENDNLEVVEIKNLLTAELEEACKLILIQSPTSDLSEEELALLQDFLKKGNRIFLLSDPEAFTDKLVNFAALCESYGLSQVEGAIFEEDPNYYYLSPYYLFPTMKAHEITNPLIGAGYYTFLAGAHGLALNETEGVTHTTLLQSSEKSYSETNFLDAETEPSKSEEEIAGPLSLGILAEKKEDQSALLWIGTSSLLSDNTASLSSGANISLFLNSCEWLCGKADTISIRTADLTGDYLTINEQAGTVWTAIFCAVIPVAVGFAGLGVWLKRRAR